MTQETVFVPASAELEKAPVKEALRHLSSVPRDVQRNVMDRMFAEQKALRNRYADARADFRKDSGEIWLAALVRSVKAVGGMYKGRMAFDPEDSDLVTKALDDELAAFKAVQRNRKAKGPSIVEQLDRHRGLILQMRKKGFTVDLMRRYLYEKYKVKGGKGKLVTVSYLARWIRDNLPPETPATPTE